MKTKIEINCNDGTELITHLEVIIQDIREKIEIAKVKDIKNQ